MGTAAVQIARALGAIVVGTAGTKDGMDVVTRYSHPLLFQKYSIFFSSGAEHTMCSITTTSLMKRKW